MKINVTATDIDKGIRSDDTHCPIALAVKRALRKRKGLFVTDIGIEWENKDERIEKLCGLPARARKFVERFDEGKPVKPFSFNIEVIEVKECTLK